MNTTPVPNAVTDLIYVLVSVDAVEGAEHHPDDLDDDGEEAISGTYGYAIHPDAAAGRDDSDDPDADDLDPAIEEALDEFHDTTGIKVLDNFEISAERIASPEAAPEDTSWH